MWKKLLFATLYHTETLKNITISEFPSVLKNYLNDFSKKIYKKSIGNKLKILNYNWKNQTKSSKTILVEDLITDRLSELSYEDNNQTVLTIHNSKGLEARSVFVHAENDEELREWLGENSQEEARVGYVAFSRAKEFLCIWAPGMNQQDYLSLNNSVAFISAGEK